MNFNTSVIISSITSAVLLIVGILLMTGVILAGAERSTRLVFGGILIAYSIFRMLNTYSKYKSAMLAERSEEMKKQTEKLLKRK
jgi:uncharacterized Tic20 family protein